MTFTGPVLVTFDGKSRDATVLASSSKQTSLITFHATAGAQGVIPVFNPLDPQHSTLNTQHSTLNPHLSILNSQPSTLKSQPSTINPRAKTPNPKPSTLHHQPYTLNVQPQTPNLIPATPRCNQAEDMPSCVRGPWRLQPSPDDSPRVLSSS